MHGDNHKTSQGDYDMGFAIVRHAFSMVFGNFGQALRLSVGPVLIAAVLIYAVAAALRIGMVSIMFMFMNPANVDPAIPLFLIFAFIVVTFTSAWIAVSWHRFILKEEYTGLLPQLRGRPVGRYIIKTLGITLWVILVAALAGFVLGFILAVTGSENSFIAGMIGGVLVGALVSYVWFRLALVLPSIAIDRPMTLGESRAATKPISGTIWQVVFILAFLSFIAQTVVGAIVPGSPAVQLTLNAVLTWFTTMIGLSVLTTFYGHLIEGRDLAT